MATNRIKELRMMKNMTQSELGEILNVQKSAVSKYEKGRAEPSMDILRKLANYFNVTTDYILCRTDDPTPRDSAASRQPAARSDSDAPSSPRLSERAEQHAHLYDALSDDHKDALDNQAKFFYQQEHSIEKECKTYSAN